LRLCIDSTALFRIASLVWATRFVALYRVKVEMWQDGPEAGWSVGIVKGERERHGEVVSA
jgi:hypothetical protein